MRASRVSHNEAQASQKHPYRATPSCLKCAPALAPVSHFLRHGIARIAIRHRNKLVDAVNVLSSVRGIAFTRFTSADVVRHPLVGRIVDAYEAAGAATASAEALRDGGKK